MINRLFIVLIFLVSLCSFSQEEDTLLIRLQQEAKLATEGITKVKTLINLGNYQITRDFREAEKPLSEALQLVKRIPKKIKQSNQRLYMRPWEL